MNPPRCAVVGTGLIGGSIALALGAAAWDRSLAVRERARARGIRVTDTLDEALEGAEIVLVAVPARETGDVLRAAAAQVPGAVFTDVASWKRGVIEMSESLPPGIRYVAGHPMAGSTASGVEGADPRMFAGRPWLFVPTPRSDTASIEALGGCVRSFGAVPMVIDHARHDFVMIWISHLPLLASAGLARSVCRAVGSDVGLLAGPGLIDTTRLAGTPLSLSAELALSSPEDLADALETFSRELSKVAALLRNGDRAALESFLQDASSARADIARTVGKTAG
ncbi:MAG TPA: prephenate dehydrogenase/arogenate dehydrogenase family protein [Thermoanaerobaculia bacterium]|nr:prephenate dehydrogenase/arogenate dehydrogenase family protein [Thermoanaerobaculia bacterium]